MLHHRKCTYEQCLLRVETMQIIQAALESKTGITSCPTFFIPGNASKMVVDPPSSWLAASSNPFGLGTFFVFLEPQNYCFIWPSSETFEALLIMNHFSSKEGFGILVSIVIMAWFFPSILWRQRSFGLHFQFSVSLSCHQCSKMKCCFYRGGGENNHQKIYKAPSLETKRGITSTLLLTRNVHFGEAQPSWSFKATANGNRINVFLVKTVASNWSYILTFRYML